MNQSQLLDTLVDAGAEEEAEEGGEASDRP